MKCVKCNRNIPNDARLCPYCGTPITTQAKITEKVYNDSLSNLREFLGKTPIDINKAKVIDWRSDTIEEKPKRPKSFYVIIAIMIITGTVLMSILLLS